MSYTKKRVVIRITLTEAGQSTPSQSQSFDESGTNTVELDGYRVSASITKAGGDSQGQAQVRVYGMSMSLMNQLSSLGRTPVDIRKNTIDILAGDESGVSLVFSGQIQQAFTDLGGAPESVFQIFALAAIFEAVQSIPGTSYKGVVSAAQVLSGLATQVGLRFENSGVDNIMLTNPTFAGSALTQIKTLCANYGIEFIIDLGTLAVWPRGGARQGSMPLISPETGLVGYPFPSGNGKLGLKSVFNPEIVFAAHVQVQSSILPACGIWTVTNIVHDLEAEMPGGQWFTSLLAWPVGLLPGDKLPGAS